MQSGNTEKVTFLYRFGHEFSSPTFEILDDNRVRIQRGGKNIITTIDHIFEMLWNGPLDA